MHRHFLRIPAEETLPDVRGFTVDSPSVARHLSRIGRTFLHGYHTALGELGAPGPEELAERLRDLPSGWRGFAFEGAGLALAILDFLTLSPRASRGERLAQFLDGPAWNQRYLVHVGAGWSLARLPRRMGPFLNRFQHRYRWLVVDGYGFHHGFFGWRRSVSRRRVPRRVQGYSGRAFDQGLGRSLWFVCGASPERIDTAIGRFEEVRRGDLWSGVGLACAYAGGVTAEAVARLRKLAGRWAPDLAQGAAFAAAARVTADDASPDTDLASRLLCGVSAADAAELAERAMEQAERVGAGDGTPSYEVWRRSTRALLRPKGAAA